MPESSSRKRPASAAPTVRSTTPQPSPPWYAPVMVGLFIVGLAYIVTFYLSQQQYPLPSLGRWNIVVGFGVIMAGFGMATRWR